MPGLSPVAVPGLRDHLRRIGTAPGRAERAAAFDDLTRAAEATGSVVPLLQRLLAGDTNGLRFALEVAARLTPPLPTEVIAPLAALVERSRFPTRLRVEVVAKLIRSVHYQSPLVPRLIDALRKKVAGPRAENRLRRLAALVPPLEPLAAALAELEAGSTSACPRCGVRLGSDALIRHLWEQHHLLLENGRVREPWDVVGDLLADYRRTGLADYLDRACDLAQALEPAEGLTRVHRLLLVAGSDDEEAHALLRADAAEKHGSLCPHCYTLVRLPAPVPATPVLVGGGRVEGGGYRVDLGDHYVFNRLTIDTPEARLEAGLEPEHALTRRGAVFLFAVPLLFMAALFAVMPRLFGIPPIVPVAGLLFTMVVAYLAVRTVWTDRRDLADRAVDHAWTRLVPRLLQGDVTRPEAAFVAGLSLASRPHGDAGARDELVRRAAETMGADRQAAAYVTPVRLLRITDAARPGFDDLPPIADEVGLSFTGQLGLDHAEAVVKELRGDPAARTRRARLRVLILAKAFEAGFEPADLRVIGRLSPALGAAYASEDRDGLARLRLLWLYRPHRLWQRIGSATSVFDLARYPSLSENYLKLRPDLLLFQAAGGPDEGSPILVCEQGVVFRDELVTRDTPVRVKAKSLIRGGGYELSVGDRVFKFRDDPTLLARRLMGWAEFLFDEFLPRARVLGRRRSAEGDRLIGQKSVTCPECRRTFLALAGEIGLKAVPSVENGGRISMNLFLIGYRGSGKTTVGRALADRLGWPFRDADDVLEERAGKTIRDIFAADGEPAFRDLESAVLADLAKLTNTVVATGGGIVLREANRQLLVANGFVAWLTADAATLWARIQGDPTTADRRPALAGGGLEEVERLLAVREPLYRAVADTEVAVGTVSPDRAADAILAAWKRSWKSSGSASSS